MQTLRMGVILGVAGILAAGCGGDSTDVQKTAAGLAVGSACTQDSDCEQALACGTQGTCEADDGAPDGSDESDDSNESDDGADAGVASGDDSNESDGGADDTDAGSTACSVDSDCGISQVCSEGECADAEDGD